ncbi:MAG: outer membrane protein assembly factor BamD [Deltaproteobacteria bacterium]|nr:outer membrane protein assembly factor BamD [Deltaproteobacteria bacterium]
MPQTPSAPHSRPAHSRPAQAPAARRPRTRALASLLALAVLALLGAGCQNVAFPPSCVWPFCGSDDDVLVFEDVPPADELYAEGEQILKGRRILKVYTAINYDKAIETFQTIIDNYPYSEWAVKAELKIADAYFDDKRYEEALSYYRSFADLHPQHERVPYTILQSALSHYEQIRSVNRDQSAAREAQRYLEQLIRQYPYAPETSQGESLLREIRTRLSRNVMQMGDFYRKRLEYQAAAERYRSLLNTYPGLGLDAEALYKLGICYENMNRDDEALRLFHVVVENYRDTRLAENAAERIARAN